MFNCKTKNSCRNQYDFNEKMLLDIQKEKPSSVCPKQAKKPLTKIVQQGVAYSSARDFYKSLNRKH